MGLEKCHLTTQLKWYLYWALWAFDPIKIGLNSFNNGANPDKTPPWKLADKILRTNTKAPNPAGESALAYKGQFADDNFQAVPQMNACRVHQGKSFILRTSSSCSEVVQKGSFVLTTKSLRERLHTAGLTKVYAFASKLEKRNIPAILRNTSH